MTSFEARIPAKKHRDVQDALVVDHGIEASIEPAREGRWLIIVAGEMKGARLAIEQALTDVGGSIVEN